MLVARDASTVAEPLRITAADVNDLNRASVERAAAIARLAGNLVVAAGAVGLLAWVWASVRTQQNLGGFTLAFSDVSSENDPDLVPRQATFARFTSARSSVLSALRFRQAM